ncbi:hypothetical protein BCU68_11845 [Vibrio sp. 10N.286.49.B3]|nr:hypothetical protein BCU68_11845 [Vibrio sp. 10N.286.49.B3]
MEATFKFHNAAVQYVKNDYVVTLEPQFRHSIIMSLLWLVKETDHLWLLGNLAQSNAIINYKTNSLYKHQAAKAFRSILHMPERYNHSVVTRTDIAMRTQTGIRTMVELENANSSNTLRPDEVLMMKIRSEYAPRIASRPYNTVNDIHDKLNVLSEHIEST